MNQWYRLDEDVPNLQFNARFKSGLRSIEVFPKGGLIETMTYNGDLDMCCYYGNEPIPPRILKYCSLVDSKSWTIEDLLDDIGSHELVKVVKELVECNQLTFNQVLDAAIKTKSVTPDRYGMEKPA